MSDPQNPHHRKLAPGDTRTVARESTGGFTPDEVSEVIAAAVAITDQVLRLADVVDEMKWQAFDEDAFLSYAANDPQIQLGGAPEIQRKWRFGEALT